MTCLRLPVAVLLALLPSGVSAADPRPDVLVYAPFDGNLRCWLGSGLVETADFSRPTLATTHGLKRVGEDEPRYVSGKFGRAIYLEPGGTDLARGVRNILLPGQADPEAETSGFTAIQGAQLTLATPGLVGQKSLRVATANAGSGFATTAIPAPRVMRYVGSAYLRGAKGGEKVRLALVDRAAGVESDAREVTLTTDWQRAFCVLEVTERDQTFRGKKLESLPALQLVITSADNGPSAFFADALMVEQSGIFYVNAQSPTSWLPGLHTRAHERLSLPLSETTFNPDEGTVAFWVRPDDFLGARCFFSVGTNHFFPWGVNIGQKGLGFGARDAYQFIPKWHALGLQPEQSPTRHSFGDGAWTHVALTWTKERVRLFLNGKPVGDGPCNNEKFDPQRLKTEHVTIGVGGYAHPGWTPNQFAKAALDEFLILRRELAPEDVAALAASQTPLNLVKPLAVELTLPVRVLGRELGTFPLPVQVTNLSPKPLADMRAALSIPSHPAIQSSLPRLNPNEPQSLSFPVRVSHLREGAYPVEVRVGEQTGRFTLEVGPFKNWQKLQVMTWRYGGAPELDEKLRDHGVTVAGSHSPYASNVNNRAGLFSMWSYHEIGATDPGDPSQFIVGLRGQKTAAAVLDHPAVRGRAATHSEAAGRMLAGHPGCRVVIINTEWESSLDFSEASRRHALDKFGVDMAQWMQASGYDGIVHLPFNRLNPHVGDKRWLPKDGIVRPDNGLYRYHRWWHKQAALVPHNETLAAGIQRFAPDVQTIQEPILRCPPIKRFSNMDIAEEWVYYPDPKNMVWVQENLTAVCRGTRMRPTGMPQFLFKPGMAAPFGVTPPPELLREAVWLCCAQPIRHIMFWNFDAALFQGKQADLETVNKRFAGMDWKTADANLTKTGPESRDVHLWHPGTAPEFKRLSQTLWDPFGGLIIRWQNRPRRLAVINSFAASLFSGERWYRHGWLGQAIAESGLPYDVLYDEDFEENPRRLDGYDVVITPVAPALTEPTVRQLREFLAAGKLVIVDERFGVALDGVTRLEPEQSEDVKARLKAEQDAIQREVERLTATHGQAAPVVVEAAQSADAPWRALGRHQGLARLLKDRLRLEVEPLTPDVVFNVLDASGANYLVAVNDRRGFGPFLGQWQRCREQGVPQRAKFRVRKALGAAAYDLTRSRSLPLRAEGDSCLLEVDLPPCGGAIVAFYPESIGKLAMSAPATVARGEDVTLELSLVGASGKPFPGLVPVRLDITDPEGRRSSFSRGTVVENGRLSLSIPVAVNDRQGEWQAAVRELATGQEAKAMWRVP